MCYKIVFIDKEQINDWDDGTTGFNLIEHDIVSRMCPVLHGKIKAFLQILDEPCRPLLRIGKGSAQK